MRRSFRVLIFIGAWLSGITLASFFSTNRRVDITWPYVQHKFGPVGSRAEAIVKQILIKPGEYLASSELSNHRISEIMEKCDLCGMSIQQGLSLRKQLMVQKIMDRSRDLIKNFNKFKKEYNGGKSIVKLSRELDQPSVALFRAILLDRVKIAFPDLQEKDQKYLVKIALREEGIVYDTLMNARDRDELMKAKSVDHVSFSVDPASERQTSLEWEESLYYFLDDAGIKYIKEDEMKAAKLSSTPDVVLLDDLFINGSPVKWIDSKCFYGSAGSRLFLSKLIKQSKRYDEEFEGPGAIVYRLGFSIALQDLLSGSLLLDSGPLDVSRVPSE